MQIPYRQLGPVYYIVFAIKGQTKATATFKIISAIYGLILFKFGVQVAYWQPFSVCFMAFTIKGQIKAAAAFKDISAIY